MKTKAKKSFIFLSILFLFMAVCHWMGTPVWAKSEETGLLTKRTDFVTALTNAKDGDTLLVGDIDFNLEGTGAVNTWERITVNKNITIKSGKPNGEKALFTGASFDLKGTLMAGERSTVTFAGITFDEKINTSALTQKDWELSYDGMGEAISPQPLKSQYAVQFFGSLDANFERCDFQNYMNAYGSAMSAYYNSDGIEYVNNKTHSLNLNVTNCNFSANAALYGGGAIYLQALNRNVKFKAVGCTFDQNKSGFVAHASGGGAIYTHGADVELIACNFTKNVANHHYGGEKPTNDKIQGGAVYVNGGSVSNGCSLVMRSCTVKENVASNGGGIAVDVMTNTVIDNCNIANNIAKPACEDTRNVWGLSAGQGQGGGLYFDGTQGNVTVINTDVTGNYAEAIFPAICYETSGDEGLLTVDVALCSIAGNVCGTQMSEYKNVDNPAWLWFTYPGDVYELSYVNVVGSIVIDEDFDTNFSRHELPSEENDYNYFASPDTAVIDGYLTEDDHAVVPSNQILPKDLYASYYSDLNIVPIGDFRVGSSSHPSVKILLSADGKLMDEIEYIYGIFIELPTIERKWSAFDGWFTTDDTQITDVNFLFAPTVRSFALTAKQTDVFPYENVIGGTATVNEDGTVTLVADPAPEGQVFKGWQISNKIVSSQSTYSFDFAEGMVITAVYEPKGLTDGAIVGIVLAGVAVCAFVAFAVWYARKRKLAAQLAQASVPAAEKPRPDTGSLTERESQVLELLLQGKKRSEIASALYVSEETIKKQITSIYGKLGVSSRSELFALFQ